MYELKAGTSRLVGAIERAAADPERLQAIADLLFYVPSQLKQDVQALADFQAMYENEPVKENARS